MSGFERVKYKSHRYRNDHRVVSLAAVTLAMVVGSPAVRGEGLTVEHKVKAGFLVNFAKFVKWPAGSGVSNTAFVFGVYGESPVASYLTKSTRNKKCKGLPIVVRQIAKGEALSGCHVLFVPKSRERDLASILRETEGKSVLVVADTKKGCKNGAALGFFRETSKVRFAVNPRAAKKARLEISSRLLKLGKIVREESP